MPSDADFDEVLASIAEHGNVIQALRANNVSSGTFYRRIATDDAFAGKYARAKSCGCHAMGDETVRLPHKLPPDATSEQIQICKLQIETRKWHLARMLPRVYGDRTILAGDADNPLAVEVADPKALLLRGLTPPTPEGGEGSQGSGTDA